MARPLDIDRRRELSQKAVDVMRREGIDISMTRLADCLEIKRPTLHYYFADRFSIFALALQELLAEQAQFVLERMAEHEHPIDQLYARILAVHEFHKRREERIVFLTQAIAGAGAERTRAIVALADQVFAVHRNELGGRIREGIESGTVHPCDPDALMRLCRAVIDGLLVQSVVGEVNLEPVHELLWTQLLQPLKRDPNEAKGDDDEE